MKKSIKYMVVLAGGLLLSTTACEDILEEQPRSIITPQIMETNQGVESALIGLYSHLRGIYGPFGGWYLGELGTDELTWANQVQGGDEIRLIDEFTINKNIGRLGALYGSSTFAYINTANAIVSYGTEGNVDKKLIAEARVMRCHDIFLLVQLYGGIPLDGGSGVGEFNTKPNRTSVRNTVDECYEYMIKDLETAEADLQGVTRDSRKKGCITQAYAQFLLSKVYLTYAWYLKNNNKGGEAQYFQKAYDMAMKVVDESGVDGKAGSNGFGLLKDFHDVSLAENDRNIEILLYADRNNEAGYDYSEGSSWCGEDAKGNVVGMGMRCWFDNNIIKIEGQKGKALKRQALQDYGRPWRRVAPTYEVVTQIFDRKDIDSRYEGTFQTKWICNNDDKTAYGVLKQPFSLGDVVFYMPGEELPDATICQLETGEKGELNIPCQVLPDENCAVFTPKYMNREYFPSLWKIGPWSPDQADAYANGSSLRPFNIAKVSEAYLVAAEAQIMGASGSKTAQELLDVLRRRAAYRASNSDAENAADADEMASLTPSNPDIDYLLDERMRELYGEQLRWYDLVRTKKLSRAATYSIAEFSPTELKETTLHTRSGLVGITDNSYLYLRPIPQGFIDNLDMTESEKAAYQNPGY